MRSREREISTVHHSLVDALWSMLCLLEPLERGKPSHPLHENEHRRVHREYGRVEASRNEKRRPAPKEWMTSSCVRPDPLALSSSSERGERRVVETGVSTLHLYVSPSPAVP